MNLTAASISAPRTLVVFAHGKESGPWGSKIKHLAALAGQRGAQVLSPDYADLSDPEQRVQRLLALPLPAHDRLVLVGSSMGGYVSAVASGTLAPQGLFLIAPAVYMPAYAQHSMAVRAAHTVVVFGRQDEVIPVANGIRFAHEHRADLHIIEGDHRLNNQLVKLGRLFDVFLTDLADLDGQEKLADQQQCNEAKEF